MKDRIGEIHTIKLRIKDSSKFGELIDAHLNNTLIAGCEVMGIGLGDYFSYIEPRCDGCEEPQDEDSVRLYCEDCFNSGDCSWF